MSLFCILSLHLMGLLHAIIGAAANQKAKELNQGFLVVKLKSSLRTFYGHHHDLFNGYGVSMSQMNMNIFRFTQSQYRPFFSFMTYHRFLNNCNTTGATSGIGTTYTTVVPQFTAGCCCSLYPIPCFPFFYFRVVSPTISVL